MAMRIVENTPMDLKMRDRTLWISIVCFCAAAVQIGCDLLGRAESSQLIPAAIAVAFGLAFFRATDVTFDKVYRTCAIRRFDVVRILRIRLAFEEIEDIKIEVCPSDDDSVLYRLSIVTAAATIPLTVSSEPGLERHNSMRDALLDVLFADTARPVATDPVHDLIKAGRIIDAVVVLRTRDKLDLTTARTRVDELRDSVGQ
jgi:hypothetical protein